MYYDPVGKSKFVISFLAACSLKGVKDLSVRCQRVNSETCSGILSADIVIFGAYNRQE